MIYFNYLRYKITLNAIKIKEKPRKFILAQINSLKLGKIYLRVLQTYPPYRNLVPRFG
jgi:hypothetical protein